MVRDNLDTDPFPYLGLAEKEILKRLALLEGLSEGEVLNLLVRARARSLGGLKELLDETHAGLSQPAALVVKSLHLRRATVAPVESDGLTPGRPPAK